MAELAKGQLRNKLKEVEAALTGTVDQHQRFLLAHQLGHIDFLDEQLEALSQHLEQMSPLLADDDDEPDGPAATQAIEPLSWASAIE